MVKKYSPFWSVLPYYVRCLILKLFIKSGTKKNFCSFKLPKLWYFVMAALENSYTISKKKSHMMI